MNPQSHEMLILSNPRKAKSVAEQLIVDLYDWRLLEFPSTGDRHLVGFPKGISDSRVTTQIVTVDLASRKLKTQSGRVYRLCTPPTTSTNRLKVIYLHAQLCDLEMECSRDVSQELWDAMRNNSN